MIQFTRMINTIDAHTAGEPLRIVTSGLPGIPGATMLEKKAWFDENLDGVRNLIMREPRGHRDMFGCVLTSPVTDDGDFGVLFTHTTGQATMCGHGIIGVTKVVLQTGIVEAHEGENIVRIDAPAGRVTARAVVKNGVVDEVSFRNVPSFLYRDNIKIGDMEVAISFGGGFYLFVEGEKLGLTIESSEASQISKVAMRLLRWGNENLEVVHPENPGISGIYGVIVTSPAEKTEKGWKSREACVFADGAVDRSPCGTGTSARMALLYGRGQMHSGEEFNNGSIIGTRFRGTIDETVTVKNKMAIVPRIAGSAWIVGFNQLVLDPDDPLPEGFLV